MRSKVKIQVSAPVADKEKVKVWLDDKLCGTFSVEKRFTPIDEALILVGVERIVYDGEGDFRQEMTHTPDSLKSNLTRNFRPPRTLGEVRLSKIWAEGAEEYIVKVTINGVECGDTTPKLNYRSLRTILNALNFDVELVGVD
jgi:hypothetical protein